MVHEDIWDERLATGISRFWVDALIGLCCTRCELMIMEWGVREGSLNFIFLGDIRVEDKKERDQRRRGKSLRWTRTAQNTMCTSMYHSQYSRSYTWSSVFSQQYEIFLLHSGKSYPRFTTSPCILHIIPIFILDLSSLSTSPLSSQIAKIKHRSRSPHATLRS